MTEKKLKQRPRKRTARELLTEGKREPVALTEAPFEFATCDVVVGGVEYQPSGSGGSRPRGRCSLTPELVEQIAKLVEDGAWRIQASISLGVPRGTYNTWTREGARQIRAKEAGEIDELGIQGQFLEALEHAETIHHAAAQLLINKRGTPELVYKNMLHRHAKYYRSDGRTLDDETGLEATDRASLLDDLKRRLQGVRSPPDLKVVGGTDKKT